MMNGRVEGVWELWAKGLEGNRLKGQQWGGHGPAGGEQGGGGGGGEDLYILLLREQSAD